MSNYQVINGYQINCWNNYKNILGIPEKYCYLRGNPVKVQVPVDIATGGLMVIGAYPTAHFNSIGDERDVPVGDHLYPFSNEKYFDGSYVREVDSGRELEELFLKPLGKIARENCWITDLVKVFLFKEGHVKKYERLGFNANLVTRDRFMGLAKASIPFIHEEVDLCQPKVILGLGSEVNAVLLGISIKDATAEMALSNEHSYEVNGKNHSYFGCPHPGILMRGGEQSKKWKDILIQTLEHVREKL
jgi:uracil-DNA glycosylase